MAIPGLGIQRYQFGTEEKSSFRLPEGAQVTESRFETSPGLKRWYSHLKEGYRSLRKGLYQFTNRPMNRAKNSALLGETSHTID